MDENIYSKLVGFSKFPTYFYMKTLINYYDYEFLKNTLIHISVLSIWKYKNSITIILSSMLCTF
jgi:hypothetical protein